MPTLIVSLGIFFFTYIGNSGWVNSVKEVTEAAEESLTYFREQTVFKEQRPPAEQRSAHCAFITAGSRGRPRHRPKAHKFWIWGIPKDEAPGHTHRRPGAHLDSHVHGQWQSSTLETRWKKLAWALCTIRGFLFVGMWLHLRFFSNHWLPRQWVHACACACACVTQREREGDWVPAGKSIARFVEISHKPSDPGENCKSLVLTLV